MKNEKKKQKENLRLLRSYSLCACMLFLGGIAFPMPSNASTATELATQQKGKQISGTVTDSHGVPVIGAQFKQKQLKVKMREMNCKWLRMSNIS